MPDDKLREAARRWLLTNQIGDMEIPDLMAAFAREQVEEELRGLRDEVAAINSASAVDAEPWIGMRDAAIESIEARLKGGEGGS